MKQKLLLKTMLLLCALIVGGASSVWAADTYTKVTSLSGINTTDSYIIVCEASNVAMKAYDSGNNHKTVSATISDGTASSVETGVALLTLESTGTDNQYYLKDQNNKYLLAVAKQNYLKTQASKADACKFTIAYSGSNVTITSTVAPKSGSWNPSQMRYNSGSSCFACYGTGQSDVAIYKKQAAKTASDLTITNSESTINLSIGGTTTGAITYSTSSDGTMHFTSNNTSVATVNASGTVTAVAEGTTTITVSQDEGTSYAASSNLSVTINVTDARSAVGTITAISPTTVYVGQTDDFTLTQSMTGAVANYTWSLGSGEDTYLTLADETFEGVAEGDVTVTVTATPTDASTYKPVTASFPVSVEYKYAAPSLPAAAVFFSTKSITIPAIAGADVYYTTDGSTPTKSSTKYTAAFEVSATKTVKAIAIDEDGCVSPVASVTYTKEDVLDINLTEVTFQDFSGAGSGYDNGAEKNLTFTATDGETKLKITGTNIMSNSGLQVRSTPGTFTTQYIKNAEKAFSLTATFTNGLSYKISYADGSDDTSGTLTSGTAITPNSFPCKFTFTRSSGTPVITKIVLTPLKDPIATGVSVTDPGTLAKGATGSFVGASTDADDCSKAWTSSDASVIEIKNAAAGTYEAKGRGTAKITYTITPEDGTTYRAVSANINVNVTEPVVITVSDVDMTYGDAAKAIGATTSASYAGTLSYASGNTSIATVDATGKVTAVAVGTTTITISAPADAEHLYTAGEDKVISVTVNAPAGGEVAATNTQTADDYEALTSAATGWTYTNWTTHSTYGACSTAGTAGTLKTKDYTIPEKANPCVFFEHTGKTFDNPSAACKLYVQEGANTPVELTIPTYFKGDKYDDPYIESGDIDITAYRGKTVHFIFDYAPSTDNEGKWEVKNFGIYYDIFSVKLNGSGYATYCSEYPLDFSAAEGYTAWQVKGTSGTAITFEKITGSVKGGTGILLKGEANALITLTSEDSNNTLGSNMLVGTMAPTYVTTVNGDYTNFGLSGETFKKINDGTVKAGKAYLPILTANVPNAAARLTFIFEDSETTGISDASRLKDNGEMRNDNFFNLKGQRVAQPTKGGLYIVNGKKVVIK